VALSLRAVATAVRPLPCARSRRRRSPLRRGCRDLGNCVVELHRARYPKVTAPYELPSWSEPPNPDEAGEFTLGEGPGPELPWCPERLSPPTDPSMR
jgi:hypothetical protein